MGFEQKIKRKEIKSCIAAIHTQILRVFYQGLERGPLGDPSCEKENCQNFDSRK
ncbi:MAG: hypothetical protein MJA29_11220 [Candidatus Omnitrophica bacterium]|nr:hypothetical protein [Candidatus Omnitrophota bacterium]